MSRAHALPRQPLAPEAAGPLQGVRVLDLSRLVAGNMLTLQLGDFGADVIKVEAAGSGDTLREWCEPHPEHPEGFDGWWRIYARNKRSLALDFRNAQAMDWLRRLIASAQVLVESFRPGTLEAMGLGPDALLALQPGLVIVRLSGWGQTGPYRTLPGFGSLIEGFSGYAHKHRDARGEPQLPHMALADMVTGLTGAFATLAALREVELRGGRGQVVDLSLLEPMLAIMGPDVAAYAATGTDPEPGRKIASPRGSYRCKDGLWVSMSGSTEAMARRVFAQVDRLVSDFIATLDQAECLALFRSKGVTVGPVYAPPQLLNDPHVAERGVYVQLDAAEGEPPTVMHQVTPRLQGTPGSIRRPAPRRGQHTRELLAELGATDAEAEALQGQGAIECR